MRRKRKRKEITTGPDIDESLNNGTSTEAESSSAARLLGGLDASTKVLYHSIWEFCYGSAPTPSQLLETIRTPRRLLGLYTSLKQASSCLQPTTQPNSNGIEEIEEDEAVNMEEEQVIRPEMNLNPSSIQQGKYWGQRYRLFSKYSQGIQMDEESWFSVTPELIAKHIAQRVWKSELCNQTETDDLLSSQVSLPSIESKSIEPHPWLVLDGFCGPGGNAIQLACEAPGAALIFAVDIDPVKIALAKNNAQVYGVSSKIEFIIGDFLKIAPKFKADVVLLAPPWGGPSYLNSPQYDLENLKPIHGQALYEITKPITSNIVYLLPRNVNQAELVALADPGILMECEGNYINGKLKMMTAYYGHLAKNKLQQAPTNVFAEYQVIALPEYLEAEEYPEEEY